MEEAERSEEDMEDQRSRFRAFRGGMATRSAWLPRELAQRLSTLERQVEQAFSGVSALADAGRAARVGASFDNLLGGYARVRRWLYGNAGDLGAGLGGSALRAFYRYWWRVEPWGFERIPSTGRVLLVANRSAGFLPYDALMLPVAMATDHPGHRHVVSLLDETLFSVPVLAGLLERIDARPASPSVLRRVLERDEAALVFPERPAAAAKSFARRYRVGAFRRPGYLKVAIATGTPIVPVAVIGAEEAQPVLTRVPTLTRLGLPDLPLTPTFPWLGVLGLLPLPTKWSIHVGDPLDVAASYPAARASDPDAVRQLGDRVRERLQGVVSDGLRRRRGLFA